MTGAGIDAVRAALDGLRDRGRRRLGGSPAADLAIDRVFAVKGRGTVVTGSLRGGPLARGDTLRLVPGDGTVRVREVQVHGRPSTVEGGGRTALNLAGVDADELHRGMC